MLDTKRVERALAEALRDADGDLVAAYLYGSVARGTAGPSSDVDVALLFRTERPRTLEGLPLALEAQLERALAAPVQTVVLNEAPVDLVHRVLRDGLVILDRDRSARIRFEVRARNEYFDLLPVLRQYRRAQARAS